jgi:NAD(P)H dehydrogenase (quinone)
MTTYAVTGATGPFGHHVVETLLERGIAGTDVVAIVRTPAKAADLAARGVEVRAGDYSRPDTLAGALAGVDTLLLVSGNEVGQRVGQHDAVIDAAKAAGVGRILYTSILHADTSEIALAPEHKATEELIVASGLPYVFLRNSWYLENYTDRLAEYLARGVIADAAGDGRVAAATRADFAEAAAAAVLDADAVNVIYELGGTPFTMTELAAEITAVSGTDVVHRDVSPAELVVALQDAGLDAGTAGFVAALDEATARGALDTDSGDLAHLLGRPATPLRDVLRAAV